MRCEPGRRTRKATVRWAGSVAWRRRKVYRKTVPDRLPTTDETAAACTRRRARGAAATAGATDVAVRVVAAAPATRGAAAAAKASKPSIGATSLSRRARTVSRDIVIQTRFVSTIGTSYFLPAVSCRVLRPRTKVGGHVPRDHETPARPRRGRTPRPRARCVARRRRLEQKHLPGVPRPAGHYFCLCAE